MYEPPPVNGPDRSTQWAEYEPTNFVPPQDDFEPMPPNVPGPPPGRHYAMYRQPPTWQHASTAGFGEITAADVISSFMQNLVVIAAGAGIGYFVLETPRGAGGGALAIIGASQLPWVFKPGGLMRAVIAAAAFGGSYWLLAPDSAVMQHRAYSNRDWDYDENEGDDESDEDVGAKPSDDPSKPASSAPWIRQVA